MAAYLVVDVDDLLQRFRSRGINVDMQELAVGLRGGAALAAGLVSPEQLKAIAVADWQKHRDKGSADLQHFFHAVGYEVFDVPRRESVPDALIIHYFSYDPDPVDELILATTSRDLVPLVRRIRKTRTARIRMWGSEDVLKGTAFADSVIFQPIESILGIQTKNVAVYIDFENISISLNEQGFVVDLDHLITSFVRQAKAHGHIIKMAAYAPWGKRGALPPLVDASGREIADEASSRLALANIDPVFNLPGKNSADLRIASDVMKDLNHSDSADLFILASGDRDFNDVLNTVVMRGHAVVVWGVRGSTARQLENNPGVTVEYIDDFTSLQTHDSLGQSTLLDEPTEAFTPSQWSSVVVQFDRIANDHDGQQVPMTDLVAHLQQADIVISQERGEDLVTQALSLGVLVLMDAQGMLQLNLEHPVVQLTRLVRDRIALRVANTLQVRNWEYVNYGFLLKGLAMDRELERPGLNIDDQWRSHWIDALVREGILDRQLIPHRHNPDDLVPVIKLASHLLPTTPPALGGPAVPNVIALEDEQNWAGVTLHQLSQQEPETGDMVRRIVVSVEQFTSFRGFEWCPLGSLHRRLKEFDNGISFQRGVEYLQQNKGAEVNEYPNPQSNFNTKGISLMTRRRFIKDVLRQRDRFIGVLLDLYEADQPISPDTVRAHAPRVRWDLDLWFSIMETENVLNALPGRSGHYSLFRTHHTVNQVANRRSDDEEDDDDSAAPTLVPK